MGKGQPRLKSRLWQSAARLLERRLRAAAVLLYGSYACGREREESDIDLAVLSEGMMPGAVQLAGVRVELEQLLAHTVDLVILNRASPVLAMEVLRGHRLLANRDPQALENYTVRVLSDYFDLKIVRRPIEQMLLGRLSDLDSFAAAVKQYTKS